MKLMSCRSKNRHTILALTTIPCCRNLPRISSSVRSGSAAIRASSNSLCASTGDRLPPTGLAATVPVRRGGVPDDIANVAAFFAAEESGYVTGQVIYVDGGGTG